MVAFITLAALFALPLALAQSLQVQTPSDSYYWVASVNNSLQWTGSGPLAFSVWLSNSNSQLMAEEVKLKSVVKTALNRLDVNPGSRAPGIGYLITLKGINADSNIPPAPQVPPPANNAATDAPQTPDQGQAQGQDQNQGQQTPNQPNQPNQPDQGNDEQTPTEAQPSPTGNIPSAAAAAGSGSALALTLAGVLCALVLV